MMTIKINNRKLLIAAGLFAFTFGNVNAACLEPDVVARILIDKLEDKTSSQLIGDVLDIPSNSSKYVIAHIENPIIMRDKQKFIRDFSSQEKDMKFYRSAVGLEGVKNVNNVCHYYDPTNTAFVYLEEKVVINQAVQLQSTQVDSAATGNATLAGPSSKEELLEAISEVKKVVVGEGLGATLNDLENAVEGKICLAGNKMADRLKLKKEIEEKQGIGSFLWGRLNEAFEYAKDICGLSG